MISKQESQIDLASEMSCWLNSVMLNSVLIGNFNNERITDKRSKLVWANEWITGVGKLEEDLEELSEKMIAAVNFKEISSAEMSLISDRLLDVLKGMNIITCNMYKIINQDQSERLSAAKESAEKRLESLLAEKETITKKLNSHKYEVRTGEVKKKCESIVKMSSKLEMSKKALQDHRKFRAQCNAIEALNESGNCSIISNNPDDESTFLEEQSTTNDRRKQRRSRSLTRKVMGTMKKTIRRSLSTLCQWNHHQ